MSPIVKKQLFHGLRIFGIGIWAIIALMASTTCWKEGMGAGINIAGVLNLLIHGVGMYFFIKYDKSKEEE